MDALRIWRAGTLNEYASGFLGPGFDIPGVVRRRRRSKLHPHPKDRSLIWYLCTSDAQHRVLVSTAEINRQGYSIRILTSHLASMIIDATDDPAPPEIQEILNARVYKMFKDQESDATD